MRLLIFTLASTLSVFLGAASGASDTPAPEAANANSAEQIAKSAADLIRDLQESAALGSPRILSISLTPEQTSLTPNIRLLERVEKWLAVNGEALANAMPVSDMTLPIGWLVTLVGEDTYLFPPAMQPREDVILRIPAHQIDTVVPYVLGQQECEVTVKRVEEPGDDEPRAFMQFTIPAEAWQNAPEGLPVIKLINAQ